MTGREDVAVGDWEGEVSQTEMVKDYLFCDGRHRRLAKPGSPATARGCGELLRALLAAPVAVTVSRSIFRRVLSFTSAVDPLLKCLWGIQGAQVRP